MATELTQVETPSSLPSLAKSTSTASGRLSLRSHVSIPVTGAIPYGTLQLVRSSDSQRAPPGPTSAPRQSLDEEQSRLDVLAEGDVFLILDLPDSFTVGCDAAILSPPGTPFLGVCGLPPGPHLLWLSGANGDRSGHWFVTAPSATGRGTLRCKQWDPFNAIVGDPASRFEARVQLDALASLAPRLAKYEDHAQHLPRPPPLPPKDPPASRRASWRPPKPAPELDSDAVSEETIKGASSFSVRLFASDRD